MRVSASLCRVCWLYFTPPSRHALTYPVPPAACRPALCSSKASIVHATMSSSTSCSESRCLSTLCVLNGTKPPTRPLSMSPSLTCRGCSSKQLAQPAAQSVPPMKLATLQSEVALHSQKDGASNGSSPRSEGTCPPFRVTAFYSDVERRSYVFRLPAVSRSGVCWFSPQWNCFRRPA